MTMTTENIFFTWRTILNAKAGAAQVCEPGWIAESDGPCDPWDRQVRPLVETLGKDGEFLPGVGLRNHSWS